MARLDRATQQARVYAPIECAIVWMAAFAGHDKRGMTKQHLTD